MTAPHGAAFLYPILFCYRHYLELRLKGLIHIILDWQRAFPDTSLSLPASKRDRFSKVHSPKQLWDFIRTNSNCDSWASERERSPFEKLLCELGEQDPYSQAARYPIDTKGNQTLAGLAKNVDLGSLKQIIYKISRYLEITEGHLSDEIAVHAKMNSGEFEGESFDYFE